MQLTVLSDNHTAHGLRVGTQVEMIPAIGRSDSGTTRFYKIAGTDSVLFEIDYRDLSMR